MEASAVSTPQAQRTKASVQPKKTSRRSKRICIDSELERVDKLLNENEDEPYHFGRVVAERLRDCPKHTWADVQIDILTVLRRYRSQNTEEP